MAYTGRLGGQGRYRYVSVSTKSTRGEFHVKDFLCAHTNACRHLAAVFMRLYGSMVLALDDGGYRFMSKNPDDEVAKREIIEHAVTHAWGEYAAEHDAAAIGFV